MKVLVINYGMGNLGSVRRAFEECGAEVLVSDNPDDLVNAERIVLPGVGAFCAGMANLIAPGWPKKIRESLQTPEIHMLGICLGMQLLADKGYEGGETSGLGLIRGVVNRLEPQDGQRIPHAGWNDVRKEQDTHLLADIEDGTDFYFVHSYYFCPENSRSVLASTHYCGEFASIVGEGNVFGTQFHPEKSSKAGFRLIRNFLAR